MGKGSKWTLGVVAALVVGGPSCGVEQKKYDGLSEQHEELVQKYATLTDQNAKLLAELEELRQTDQSLWREASEQSAAKQWRKVENAVDRLIANWPKSPLISKAAKLRVVARNNLAQSVYQKAQGQIASGAAEDAEITLNHLIEEYGNTSIASKARSDLRTLDRKISAAKREREKRAKLEAQREARASSVLELTAFSWHTRHGYAIVEGMVKNISSRPIENVQAVAIFTDKNGNFITSADALIEYRPILPGQSSPVKVMQSENPAMKSARLEFKQLMGAELATYHNWRK